MYWLRESNYVLGNNQPLKKKQFASKFGPYLRGMVGTAPVSSEQPKCVEMKRMSCYKFAIHGILKRKKNNYNIKIYKHKNGNGSYFFVGHRKHADHVGYIRLTEQSELTLELQPGKRLGHFPKFYMSRSRGNQVARYKRR